MVEVLKFVFRDFWTFCGTILLVYTIGTYCIAAPFGAIACIFRKNTNSNNKGKRDRTMNNYQLIKNDVSCIRSECDEALARGANAAPILKALDDATYNKTPFEYDMKGVREEVDALEKRCDFVSDVARDIRRHCPDINIRQEHLRQDYQLIYNVIRKNVDRNLSEKITNDLLANGAKLEVDE